MYLSYTLFCYFKIGQLTKTLTFRNKHQECRPFQGTWAVFAVYLTCFDFWLWVVSSTGSGIRRKQLPKDEWENILHYGLSSQLENSSLQPDRNIHTGSLLLLQPAADALPSVPSVKGTWQHLVRGWMQKAGARSPKDWISSQGLNRAPDLSNIGITNPSSPGFPPSLPCLLKIYILNKQNLNCTKNMKNIF